MINAEKELTPEEFKSKSRTPSPSKTPNPDDNGLGSKRKREEESASKAAAGAATAEKKTPNRPKADKDSIPSAVYNQPVFGSSPIVGNKALGALTAAKSRMASMATPTGTSIKSSGFKSISSTGKSLFGSAKDSTAAETDPKNAVFSFSKYSVPTFQNVLKDKSTDGLFGKTGDTKAKDDILALPASGVVGFVSPLKKKSNSVSAGTPKSLGKNLFDASTDRTNTDVAISSGVKLTEQRQNKVQDGELALFEFIAKVFALESSSNSSSSWVEKGAGSIMLLVLKSGLGGGRIVGHRMSTGRLLLNMRILPGPLVIKDSFITLVGLEVNEKTNKPERKSYLIKPIKPTGDERLIVRNFEESHKKNPYPTASVNVEELRIGFKNAYDKVIKSMETNEPIDLKIYKEKEDCLRQILAARDKSTSSHDQEDRKEELKEKSNEESDSSEEQSDNED